ncbi:alpha/beta hydrolase [Ferruginibacter sp. SUN002]|uniref:alpha/beta hydrolase n=1 Tax=Ferruginibacter sp. SUN002 TaxID=2937789 RepID=UPI003D364ABC
MNHIRIIGFFTLMTFLSLSCTKKSKQQEDEIYSRHLQKHIKLTIISTPLPDDKKELNLLLLNDGQDVEKFRLKKILDSLYNKKLIQPVVIVAIHASDRTQEYGIAGFPDYKKNGSKADQYASFIDNELYDFAKKKAGVRKFKSVVIAGENLGGLSAFDIAWNHADKIDKVGVFSGTFRFSKRAFTTETPDYSDASDRILLSVMKSSRKKPHLKYWFYGDDADEKGIRYQDSITINHTKDLIKIIKDKKVCPDADIVYKEAGTDQNNYIGWSKVLPDFLLWAFGK